MTIDFTILTAALAAAGSLIALLTAAASRRRCVRLERRLASTEAALAAVRAEAVAAAGIGGRVGERLRRLDQLTGQLADRLGQIEVRGDGRPYDHAIALVRHGADADRLVSHFGLSRGEADLVARVHGHRKAG
jgi:hypothetical protein